MPENSSLVDFISSSGSLYVPDGESAVVGKFGGKKKPHHIYHRLGEERNNHLILI
jgi:hypothetical protein